MIIEVDSKELLSAARRAASALSSRPHANILECVLLSFEGGGFRVAGSNMAQQVSIDVQCDVELGGEQDASIAVEARILQSAIRPEGRVRLDVAGRCLNMTAGRRSASLMGFPGEDYPRFEWHGGEVSFNLSTDQLRKILLARGTMSSEETRFYLNGIHLHNTADGIRAVSTNGHTMTLSDVDMDDPTPDFSRIIPREAIAVLAAMSSESTAVTIGKNAAAFEAPGWRIETRLIDGTFPDYQRVIPSQEAAAGYIHVPSLSALANVTKSVAIFKDRERLRGASLAPEEGGLAVAACNGGDGIQDFYECEVSGDVPKITVNAEYLEAASNVIPDGAHIYIADSTSPFLILPSDAEISGVQFVLMPMRDLKNDRTT